VEAELKSGSSAGEPAVRNDPDVVEAVTHVASEVVGREAVLKLPGWTAADDAAMAIPCTSSRTRSWVRVRSPPDRIVLFRTACAASTAYESMSSASFVSHANETASPTARGGVPRLVSNTSIRSSPARMT